MGLDSLPMHMRTPELDPLCVDIINGWPPYPFIKDNWISGLLIHPQYCHSVTGQNGIGQNGTDKMARTKL